MTTPELRYYCVSSTADRLETAISECLAQLEQQATQPRWLMVLSGAYRLAEVDREFPRFHERFPDTLITGCRNMGVIDNQLEHETKPALVCWACYAEELKIHAVHLQYQRTREGASFLSSAPFEAEFGEDLKSTVLVALSDPFTFPMDIYLGRINEDYPGLKVIGGHASGADQPGESRLLLNDRVLNHGCVLIAVTGNRGDCCAVSQGCRPIGQPWVITKAERNQIFELGGRPAFSQLWELFHQSPTQEQALIRKGLHLGLVVDEYRDQFGYGDFLIRNVIGLDEEQQCIVLGDFVRVGQTVQFHVRDEQSAAQDLKEKLQHVKNANAPQLPQAALIFTCNGRGSQFFSTANHDIAAVQTHVGPVAAAGFFAAGEFGPIGSQNHLHGFTASVLLFW